jgi:tetratricopeptide (TPR) repeat protein
LLDRGGRLPKVLGKELDRLKSPNANLEINTPYQGDSGMQPRSQRTSPQQLGRALMRLGPKLTEELGSVTPAGREILRRYPKVPTLQAFRYAAGLSQDKAAAKYNEVTKHQTFMSGSGINSWEAWQRSGSGGARPSVSDLIVLGIAYGRCCAGTGTNEPVSPRDLLGSSFRRMSAEDQITITEFAERAILVPEAPQAPSALHVGEAPAVLVQANDSVPLAATADVGTTFEIPDTLRAEAATTFTPQVERVLSGLIDHGAEAANLFGSRQLVGMVLRNTEIIRSLQRSTTGERHSALTLLGSRFAEFLSWIYEELECSQESADWLNRALDWAMEADDDAMTSYVLARKSHHAMHQGDWQRAMTLAGRAARHAEVPPKVRAFALQQHARGLASLGESAEALRLFDEAENLADQQSDDNPSYVGYCSPVYVELQRAGSWAAMGDSRRGDEELAQALTRLDPSYRTDHAVFGGRRAQALAIARRPDEAVEAARQALSIAVDTQCTRAVHEVAGTIDLLDKWKNLPDVEQLRTEFTIVRNGMAVQQPAPQGY